MMTFIRNNNVRRGAVLGLAAALLAGACSFGGDDGTVESGAAGQAVESGMPKDAKPARGGQLVYGLDAEITGGYCLPEASLAISGLTVVRSIYDHLVVPDAKGGYAPYLAKSVEHSDDYKTWTIVLRDGITFHDGSKLTAKVVKNNLDAYRGAYKTRSPLLFVMTFADVDSVEEVNDLTVRVRTKRPWVAFDAMLYNSGRVAMMAQAQLDADDETCNTEPIGTGPFKFVSWTKDQSLKVERNDDYWLQAPDGEAYPYLDAIDFRPIPNTDARVAALQRGDINMLHTANGPDITGSLKQLQDDGQINMVVSEVQTESSYLMINASVDGLDDRATRVAMANALDKEKLNQLHQGGASTLADQPFTPGVMGYLEDPGAPEHDLEAAKAAVAKLKADGKPTRFRLTTSGDPHTVRQGVLMEQQLEAAGFTIDLVVISQAELVDTAISGEYDLLTFRLQPGDDPDQQFNWWYSGLPTNFGRMNDPVVDEALEEGRTNPDPDARRKAYETITKQFATEAWNLYLWRATWAVAEASNVHGILGPELPDDGGVASGRIVNGHPMTGIWIER